MARPKSKGIGYFSFDVDFFEDEKIEAISGEFQLKGEIIVIRLLCAIYRQGYFIKWTEQLQLKIAKRTNQKPALVEEVVNRLVKWEFFNKDLFHSMGILTSVSIQERWRRASKKRIGKGRIDEFNLLDGVSGGIKEEETTPKHEFREEETTQSKVKESKVNNTVCIVMEFFGFNEQNNFDKLRAIGTFIKVLESTNRIDLFNSNFQAYKEYKELTEEKTHSFLKFLGTIKEDYTDGGWNAENWVKKLENERNRRAKKDNRSSLQGNSRHKSDKKEVDKSQKDYSETFS